MDLDGKTAFITAGAGGIGRCVANRLSLRGANIVIADMDAAAAAAAAADLPSAIGVGCDVRDDEQVAHARDAALERFGDVHLVMSHAGITVPGPLGDLPESEWTRILDLNVVGMVRVLRAFLPHLTARGSGHVVLTSSSLALLSGHPLSPMAAPYIASKAAVIALAQTAATALAPHNIQVTLFAPDYTDTAFNRRPAGAAAPANPPAALMPYAKQTPEQAADALMSGLDEGRFLASATPDHERLLRLQAEALLDPAAMTTAYASTAGGR
ncbi:SDR family NAD(P)-dependent oxidoreductase [Streptomyces sp. NPDC056296]|uniref:SDR family NAD(P)-dependent oxidoreductase n=1 Tax=Streptomyces sp. NPDC056296 TaxID=3345775 RepID=UPI0035D59978